jgi:ABC-2 type transport system ATP-binding protein
VFASVSHLNRSYGSWRAVRDVSFELGAGVTGLLGPNGAGKSSLLTCLAGIARWDDGEIFIDGIDLAKKPTEARRRIGFMPERVAFPTEMRVEDYLNFICAVKSIPKKERREAVARIMPDMGLDHVRTRIIGNLSKGYRQRVGMAQALLGDPPLALLDEPMAGLDPLNVLEMRDALRQYGRDRAILVSTHLLPDARLLCDRIIVMSRGAVVYDGSTAGMASSGGGRVRVRIRLRSDGTHTDQSPGVIDGTTLLQVSPDESGHMLLVDADDEIRVAALVRTLSNEGWAVLSVEPTMDVLEDAFKRAVLGTTDPSGAESAPREPVEA